MTTSKPSLFSIVNSIILLAILIFLVVSQFETSQPQTVYLDNVAVFSNFNLAKDLNELHQKELTTQKEKVDTIVSRLQKTSPDNPNEELQRQYVYESNKLQEMSEYFTTEVSQQVWTRVNTYIKEYGKENNYAIVLGTQGNGNIMYAQAKHDITTDFIAYANTKYEGN